MKVLVQLACVLLSLVFIACDTDSKQSTTESESSSVKVESQPDEHQLSLDNGKRWAANQETTDGVNNMIQLVEGISDEGNPEEYAVLADKLEIEFKTIFQKCTMKGEAHNQLHNFLLPLKSKIKMLASNDLNECQSAREELTEYLRVYADYFE